MQKLTCLSCWFTFALTKTVLKSLVTLLEQPNPDDPLMTDIAEIYSTDQAKFQKNAKEHTKKVPYFTLSFLRDVCVSARFGD